MESEQDPIAPKPPHRRRPRAPKVELEDFSAFEENAPSNLSDEAAFLNEEAVEISNEPFDSRLKVFFASSSTLILAVALVLFLLSQIVALRQSADSLAWQSRNLGRQIETLTTARNNANGLVKQRQSMVDQSQQVTTSYNNLLNDLLNLAETDKDARSVIEKFAIKNSSAPQPAAAKPEKK
jgi:hypothetical protein